MSIWNSNDSFLRDNNLIGLTHKKRLPYAAKLRGADELFAPLPEIQYLKCRGAGSHSILRLMQNLLAIQGATGRCNPVCVTSLEIKCPDAFSRTHSQSKCAANAFLDSPSMGEWPDRETHESDRWELMAKYFSCLNWWRYASGEMQVVSGEVKYCHHVPGEKKRTPR